MTRDPTSLTVSLEDGRELGYALYGAPKGWPVLYFHGFPGSRLEWALVDPTDRANALGCRIIAIDRPGIGLSTAKARRSLLDWPPDAVALANALEIERFGVIGVSGGGPFAAACAHQFPDRVSTTVIVSGMGPTTAPGMRTGVSWTIPSKPWLLRLALLKLMSFGLSRDPDTFMQRTRQTFSTPDQTFLGEPTAANALLEAMRESLRPGIAGSEHDAAIYRAPWGFHLEDIPGQVHLWHGGLDANVPLSVAQHMATAIPRCVATVLDDEGHLSLLPKIIDDVLAAVRGPGLEDQR